MDDEKCRGMELVNEVMEKLEEVEELVGEVDVDSVDFVGAMLMMIPLQSKFNEVANKMKQRADKFKAVSETGGGK